MDKTDRSREGRNGELYFCCRWWFYLIVGSTKGDLDSQTNNGNYDVFISKFNKEGIKEWTKLFGTSGSDYPSQITTGSDDSIYIVGYTEGDLDGQINSSN